MTNPEQALEVFAFGPFTLDTFARTLDSHATTIRLQPRMFELLEYFVRKAGQTVTLFDVAEVVGQGIPAPPAMIRAEVEQLREVLNRYSPRETFIITDRDDYRFVARVTLSQIEMGGGDVAARRWHSRARYFFEKRTADALHRSIYYYRRALEVNPRFAAAHAGLARAYALSAEYLFVPPHEAYRPAQSSAQTALALAGPAMEPYLVLGQVACYYERDFAAAANWYAQAAAVEADQSDPAIFAAWLHLIDGRTAEATRILTTAAAAEPFSTVVQTTLAVTLTFERRYPEAVERLRAIRARDAASAHARLYLAQALQLAGSYDEVLELVHEPHPDGYEQEFLALRGTALAGRGDRAGAVAIVAELRALAERGRYVSPSNLALVQQALGQTDDVLGLLERGRTERDPWIVLALHHPQFDPMRSDPRFAALLRRLRPGGA
ncbi:MAG TPA: hypothetical protein VMD91_11690 [Candidatus Sulfotelmatobacter sp.]|nr:hypothetical protein [Candidatus Sulfotelmatobacter sp.]